MVVIPALTRGGIHPRAMQSLLALDLPEKKNRVTFIPIDRPTTSARSDALKTAKDIGADSVLFIDSDMEFEPDSYRRLCRVKGDIVCGLFYNRTAPSYPTICLQEKTEDGLDRLRTIIPDGKIQDIDACGMAFTLIRKPVLRWAEYPAFQHLGYLSEDFMFCIRAKQAGFKARCDTGLVISHRGDVGFAGQKELSAPESATLSFPFGVIEERQSWKIN